MSSQLHKFGYVRIAAVSPELKVADVDFNIEQIVSIIKSATEKKCHFILFPELCITGYSCADLFFQDILITQAKSSVDAIVSATAEYEATVIIGIPILSDSRLYNVAVVISCGDIKGIVPKTFLCNSNEYYEERWFSSEFERISDSIEWNGEQIPFGADLLFHHIGNPDFTFGVELCEDLWSVIPPSSEMALAGATVLLNLSASYEALGKFFYRKQLVQSQSASCIAAYVYSSAGAGESSTDLVFPGHCMVAENGVMLAESERFSFESQIIFADVDIQKLTNDRIKNNTFSKSIPARRFRRIGFCLPDLKDSTINRNLQRMPFVPEDESKRSEVCREIFSIQTTGLAKRIKHLNNCDLVIGVSGGLDSTLALLVAVKAFCKLGLDIKGIHALSMPGLGSSDRTQNNAVQLANLLGVDLRIISIKDAVLNHFSDIGHSAEKKDIVYENSQARERTQILMDVANQVKGIVVGTGDLSEMALGWSTYSGDQISMYGVNSGVPKTLVKYIVQWCSEEGFNEEIKKVLKNIYDTPISPELLPVAENGEIQQYTEKKIGPYLLHDFFLFNMVRCGYSPEKISLLAKFVFKGEFEIEEIDYYLKVFYERFFANQFKRSCTPDGMKVGTLALSPRGDWRMPSDAVVNLWIKELDNIIF